MHSTQQLVDDLRALGVNDGDVLMVHASLRRIGPVEGRAEGVVRALDLAAGESGTLMMVAGAENAWDWVNEHPESERASLLRDAVPFDCLTTPAQRDVGVLAEVFRRMPGTRVSDHPEGRFSVRGQLAEAFTRNVPWDDYYGPRSPLERFVNAGGKVLRLGADIDTVTLLHYAEYVADVPDKRRVRRHRRISTDAGPAIRVVEGLDDEHGIVPYDGPDYFGVLLQDYLTAGTARCGVVGAAWSELIDAADLLRFGIEWMNLHLGQR